MPLQPGDRLGAYEIVSPLGAGGMGVVYRARDAKLGREVAIKTLPEDVAADPERLARFEREARMLAALNHPNIATVYGFEQADATHFLTMEVVEGATLADRIERGPIPLEQALPLFIQIAEGLEAAHVKGIIHRDLKPANIKIEAGGGSGTRAGSVKILDFGLAKALEPELEARSVEASHSPTLTLQATMRGEILGTAAYMSPEQAQGLPADQRADIWAFGVCLLEALSGRRVFDGANASFVLASVLKDEPELDALPPSTPQVVRRLLRRCLEKNRERRLHDIADARLDLEEALAAPAADPEPVAAAARGARALWIAIGVAAGVGLGAAGSLLLAGWLRQAPEPSQPVRFVLNAPPAEPASDSGFNDLAITRDGGMVVHVTGTVPSTTLHLRRIDQLADVPLRGADPGAVVPFLSPDDRWVGYFDSSTRTLRKVPILGGPSATICRNDIPVGASWGADGTIVFGQIDGPLQIVPSSGGEPKDLTQLAEGETSHRFPEFLPGGAAVLFVAFDSTGMGRGTIQVRSLASGEQKVVVAGATQPRYAASGHLIYAVGSSLYAVAFDPRHLEVIGDPVPLVEGVAATWVGTAKYALSEGGELVYVGGGTADSRVLVWVDREGREEQIGAPPRAYVYPRLSPDGTRIAVDARDQEQDIWIWDLERETFARLTFSPTTDRGPVWSPDGRTVFFSSLLQETLGWDLFGSLADGTGEPTRLIAHGGFYQSGCVTPDGAGLIATWGPGTLRPEDLVWVDIAGGAEPRTLLDSEASFSNPELSSDGRWLAYESNESGAAEIFVRPFPALDTARWQVSAGGGKQPVWSRDSTELFYLSPSGLLTATEVEHRADALVFGRREVVIAKAYAAPRGGRGYDVSPDGRRFLMSKTTAEEHHETAGQIILVQNWFDELRRLAPARSN